MVARSVVNGAADMGFQHRSHSFGIDLGFDGANVRVVAQYRMMNGSAIELSAFRGGIPLCRPLHNSQFSEAELCRVGVNTFFRGIDGGLMVVLSVDANTCLCKIVSTKETTNFSIDFVRERARLYRLGLTRG